MEPPSPSLFLHLSLWRSSSLLLACAPGQVYLGVPVTDNLIINGPPGTGGPEAPRQNLNGVPDGLFKVNGSHPVCTSLL